MTNSVEIRAHIVDVFRRDLIGPGAQDADLANERLNESPSRWYLTGFLAPAEDALGLDGADDESDPSAQEEMETGVEEPDADQAGAAADNEAPEAPNTRRRFLPSSIGLTVLLDPDVNRSKRVFRGATTGPSHLCRKLSSCLNQDPRRSARTESRNVSSARLSTGCGFQRRGSSSCRSVKAAAGPLSFPKAPPSSAGEGA